MNVSIRGLQPGELEAFFQCVGQAIGFEISLEQAEAAATILDFEGSFVAEERGRVVGGVGSYWLEVTVPGGGRLPMAGTTLVGVLPTHRRRGILGRLMKAHLDSARRRGAAVAGLWASETPIYPRYDFGRAAYRGQWKVQAKRVAWAGASADDVIELVPDDEARPRVCALYETHGRERAGTLSRTDAWWNARRFFDDPSRRDGGSAFLYAVATREGRDAGYLQYRRVSRWNGGLPSDEIRIVELIGDASARRSLWRYALSIDLVETLFAFNLPVDEAVPLFITDGRRAWVEPEDSLWLCALDTARFLEARSYGYADRLVLEVHRADGGAETMELAGEDGCRPSTRSPDARLSAAALVSAAFGAHSVATLHDAELIEAEPAVRTRLERLLSTERAPWCPERF